VLGFDDADCVPAPATITPSDGVGPNLLINANLIQGNAAEAAAAAASRSRTSTARTCSLSRAPGHCIT